MKSGILVDSLNIYLNKNERFIRQIDPTIEVLLTIKIEVVKITTNTQNIF